MSWAHVIGLIVMVAGGFLLAAALLALSGWLLGAVGAHVWRRMRRTYHLFHLQHWMQRAEKEGTHIFKRPNDDWYKND